ncbi:uncharacterized protein MAM_04074 [Metarhizium album ARSEF 1941]|uniref:Uncharacterized protein n=1 Tax=Metarhizium album (strain ARSEF 1941) TaxID=1081103 RepID=A0A0B2WW95_METAS|nr:uncharacterized protein MAM_04074 [Metarhizium album ARSEF 1941]KHN98313.1 hypothetical protein MAM_04074 [Metarhizium album ARSEF 1941]
MARIVAHDSSTSHHDAQSFDIFDDKSLTPVKHVHVDANIDVLKELSHGQSQSRLTPPTGESVVGSPLAKSPRRDATTSPENSTAKAQSNRRTIRARRPQIDSDTFEPLVAVPEETSSLIEIEQDIVAASAATKDDEVKGSHKKLDQGHSPGVLGPKSALERQVEKHLAGQFEWIMTYPADAKSPTAGGSQDSQDGHNSGSESKGSIYGCNLLPVRRRRTSQTGADITTDIYTLLATPLNKDSYTTGQMMDGTRTTDGPISLAMS